MYAMFLTNNENEPNMKKSLILLLCTTVACSFPSKSEEEISESTTQYPDLTELDHTITSIMAEDGIPGVSTCIIKAGEIAWCNGYGYSNIETESKVTPQTPFMLASVSKTITGVALMHLIETNALDLDTPVNEYLIFDVQHPTDNKEITARMLLSHTSGIDDNWNAMNSVIVDGDSPLSLSDFLEGYLTPDGEWYNANQNFVDLGVEEQTHYSNIGIALAALIVEPITGLSFSTYCHDYIFEPLDMNNTAWFLSELDEQEIAVPYRKNDGNWEAVQHYGYPDYPDGALRTGAEPLAQFLSMFVNEGTYRDVEILSPSSVSEMKRPQYPDLDENQGLVWYSWNSDEIQYFGHGGGDLGVSTQIGFRDDGFGFVILMNSTGSGNTLDDIKSALIEHAAEL